MNGLRGRRIVVTRPAHQADAMADALRAAGAVPVLLPTIAIEPPDPPALLHAALRALADHDWVVFTSVNGVHAAFAAASSLGVSDDDWRRVRVAAVGPVTAAALAKQGVRTHAMPDEHRSDRIADAMGSVAGARVLLLRAERAEPDLPRLLVARGADIADVVAYRTVPARHDATARARLDGVDAVTFTSASTAHGFTVVVGNGWRKSLEGVVVASIGPVTTRGLHELRVNVDVEATTHTVDGLVAALTGYWGEG